MFTHKNNAESDIKPLAHKCSTYREGLCQSVFENVTKKIPAEAGNLLVCSQRHKIILEIIIMVLSRKLFIAYC